MRGPHSAFSVTVMRSVRATTLIEGGSRVQLLCGSELATRCKIIRMISGNQRTRPDECGNAIRRVLNHAAAGCVNWAECVPVIGNTLLFPSVPNASAAFQSASNLL